MNGTGHNPESITSKDFSAHFSRNFTDIEYYLGKYGELMLVNLSRQTGSYNGRLITLISPNDLSPKKLD